MYPGRRTCFPPNTYLMSYQVKNPTQRVGLLQSMVKIRFSLSCFRPEYASHFPLVTKSFIYSLRKTQMSVSYVIHE